MSDYMSFEQSHLLAMSHTDPKAKAELARRAREQRQRMNDDIQQTQGTVFSDIVGSFASSTDFTDTTSDFTGGGGDFGGGGSSGSF